MVQTLILGKNLIRKYKMKEIGILNNDIAEIIGNQGHMDELIVVDAGFPIPLGIKVADISLDVNKPTVLEVLEELVKYHSVEKLVLANETEETSPTRFKAMVDVFQDGIEVEMTPHTEFKKRSKGVKAIIRTGDFTAYSNILLVSGPGDRWYCEK